MAVLVRLGHSEGGYEPTRKEAQVDTRIYEITKVSWEAPCILASTQEVP